MADATPTAPGLTEADREHLRVRLASWFGDGRQAFLVSHLAPAVERIKADACAQATGDMSALHQQVAECEWLLRMTMDARDRAERQAEALDAAFERVHKVLHGWEHDGPDDPAMRLLIQRVREALLTGGEVGTGAGEGATGQDTGTAWVTRSEDCPEAPAQAHLPAGEVACPRCGGSMRFCECMDDPFAPVPAELEPENVREAFALGAAWALGDDDEAPASLRAQRDRYRTAWKSAVTRAGIAADRAEAAEVELARLKSAAERVGHQAVCPVNPCDCWMRDLAPLLDDEGFVSTCGCGCGVDGDGMCPCGCDEPECPGLCGEHHWLDRPESDTRECLICGTEVAG